MAFIFSYAPGRAKKDPFHGISPEFMRASGCSGCPLQRRPKAKPAGAMPCEVYMLGEAPGDEEAKEGTPFVGKSGKLLRSHLPPGWAKDVRYNNVVMSQPPKLDGKQTPPNAAAIAHCSGFLIEDIERSQPKAIFGFGNTPLLAMTGHSGIMKHAGRRMPIRVGNHLCWYFAFLHPAAILHADPRQRPDMEKLFAYQLRRAFARVGDLGEVRIETPTTAKQGIRVLRDAEQIAAFLDKAASLDRTGFDYETTGLSPHVSDARLLSAAVATGKETVAFPLDHPGPDWSPSEQAVVYEALRAYLEAPVLKVAHNSAFEMLWTLLFFGPRAARPNHWGDSMVQAFLLDARPGTHSLDFLCQTHFGLDLKAISNIDVAHLIDADVEDVCNYNALDAKFALMLFEKYEPLLAKIGMQRTYQHHMERIAALARCQHAGLPVDPKINYALTDQYTTRLAEIEMKLAAMPEVKAFEKDGPRFNVAATKHVATLLGMDIEKKFSTAEEQLAEIDTPLARAVLDWRGTSKIISTYLTPLGRDSPLVYNDDLHPIISTMKVRTWRTSSDHPNIQNFPKRDAAHQPVRKQIVARPGCWLVSVDYSSMQARNVAMESCDKRLVQAFVDHYDIHADWSERIQRADAGWARGRDAKALRHGAKNGLVFPFLFGAQPTSVARNLSVDFGIATDLFDSFWFEFPDVLKWHERLRTFYRREHYVTGLSKFRRDAPISDNQLINTPIQSDEALLVCEAMARLSQYEDEALQACMMIHDDLTFMVPDERFDECLPIIITEMLRTEHLWINCPLAVEVSAGKNWAEQEKIGQFESDGLGGYVELG